VLVVEEEEIVMVYLDIIQVHQVVVVVQYVIILQLGLVMILDHMIVYQWIMVLMIDLVLMIFDPIQDVITMTDVIMVMVLNMMHQVMQVTVAVAK
jgi:hypothetical protein